MWAGGVIEEAADARSFLSETIRQNIRFLYILHWNIMKNFNYRNCFPPASAFPKDSESLNKKSTETFFRCQRKQYVIDSDS